MAYKILAAHSVQPERLLLRHARRLFIECGYSAAGISILQ